MDAQQVLKGRGIGSSLLENPRSFGYRTLQAFRNVVIESSYTNAGLNMEMSRRGILKLVGDLEADLGVPLFLGERHGRVSPSPFGERLFNDSRFLEASVERFRDKVEEIKNHQRVLRVGASSLVFRTVLFRSIFRKLRSFKGCRVTFVPVSQGEAVKLLTAGELDLIFDFKKCDGARFLCQHAGNVSRKTFCCGKIPSKAAEIFQVQPKGCISNSSVGKEQDLDEEQFLHWLDHPAACPEGSMVSAPHLSVESRFWTELPLVGDGPGSLPLYAMRLRTHPYEFFPEMMESLKNWDFAS